MQVNAKSYPHPVLGNEDDLEGYFKVDFKYELGRDFVVLNPIFGIENKTIEGLIKNKKASFIVEVMCPSTFYRVSFPSRTTLGRFLIPAQRLRDRVIVWFYICADEDLPDYNPSGTHRDYEGATFEVEKSDVLATGGYCTFIAEKTFDPMRPPIASFMSIREGNSLEGPMDVDYTNSKITINLSKEDWKNYIAIRGQKQSVGTLHATIVFPVLIDAIYKVINGDESYEGNNWFVRLEAILEAKGLREKDPIISSQKILDNPASRSFQGINSLFEITESQES